MGNQKTYKTGEAPLYGDIIRGIPNRSDRPIAGIVCAGLDDMLSIVYLKAGDDCEACRVYGEAKNFELIARNEP